jgi:hypothetical protein
MQSSSNQRLIVNQPHGRNPGFYLKVCCVYDTLTRLAVRMAVADLITKFSGLLSQSLSAMVSLVPTLPMEGEHDALFESLISPHTSQYVSLVDVMASKNYSKRARTRRAIAKPSETEMMANAVVFSASHIVTDEPAILDLAGETLSISREHDVATANQLEALKAAMLDYQGPQSPAGSSSSSRENRDDRRGPGRPKGSLNKTHVPAWQTRERRRLRQKERREQARLDRAVEIERRRIEDPTFVSPKRKVGRPRKVRDPVGELVNPSTGLEEEVGLGILDQHQGVSMGLSDMSEGMGLDMTVMGLDYQSDSASFAHIHSGDHHHDHLSHSHQLPHDMLAGHGHHSELQHHHHHDPDLQDSSMHQDGGVMQMLDMPNALNDMTVGVDDETSYLTYGSETYAYTLDAIERAHAAVRAEEERNGM